jgi:hypothetical protein
VVEGRWWTERVRCRWAVSGDTGGMQRCELELSGASHYTVQHHCGVTGRRASQDEVRGRSTGRS